MDISDEISTALSEEKVMSSSATHPSASLEKKTVDSLTENPATSSDAKLIDSSAASPASLTEKDVGITQFAGDHQGFFGIIKQRFSDFLVNEISATGEELHLTDIKTVPRPPVVALEESTEDAEEDLEDIPLPTGITKEVDQQLEELLNGDSKSPEQGRLSIVVTSLSKEQRKEIHKYIQQKHYGLVSTTAEEKGEKLIEFSVGTASMLQREKKRRAPRGPRLYTHFLLYKENMDTMEAASRLASKLRLRAQDIGYAGTKDRRGKTVQLAAISKISAARIAEAAHSINRLRVGNFSYSPQNVVLGQLAGNAFKIVLREVKGSDEDVSSAVASVRKTGIINYYGLQRFGTRAGHTHDIGRHMLASEWDNAIRTILLPNSTDPRDEKSTILRGWQSKELTATEALTKLKMDRALSGGVETQLLQGIQDKGENDKLGALNHIPRNTRTMYLYAYQAYLWNKVVSRRIEQHGLKVLPGDLVAVRAADAAELEATSEEDLTLEADATAENDGSVEFINGTEAAVQKDGNGCDNKDGGRGGAKMLKLHNAVRPVKPEEVDSIQLSQVLIPAVGYAVRLPDNELAGWYKELLEEDGLTLQHFDHNQKSYAVSGAYRLLMLHPKNLSHKIRYYTDPFKPLVNSDLDRLRGACEDDEDLERDKRTEGAEAGGKPSGEETAEAMDANDSAEAMDTADSAGGESVKEEPEEESKMQDNPSDAGKIESLVKSANSDSEATFDKADAALKDEADVVRHKAVIVEFTLPPAAYATMVLRELLKIDTGSQFHASLNTSGPNEKRPWPKDGNKDGGFRGGSRGGFRGGSRGGFRGGNRGGFRGGNRGGFRGGNRGGFRGNHGGNRGGSRGGNRDSFRSGFRGGFRGGDRGDCSQNSNRGDKRSFHSSNSDQANKRFKTANVTY